jgi:hypothetical protein
MMMGLLVAAAAFVLKAANITTNARKQTPIRLAIEVLSDGQFQ